MSTYRTAADTHGPLLDEHVTGTEGDAADEEHVEFTDPKPYADDESIDASGRNVTQRALDDEPADERNRPVVVLEDDDARERTASPDRASR